MDLYDVIGLAGVCVSIYCYARVQWHRDFAKQMSYSTLNLLASILILGSFAHHWNLPSFVINAVWGVISIYGIYRCYKYIRRERKIPNE